MTEPARVSPTLREAIAVVVDQFAGQILTAASDRLDTKARILEAEGHPAGYIAGWHAAADWQRQRAKQDPPEDEPGEGQ